MTTIDDASITTVFTSAPPTASTTPDDHGQDDPPAPPVTDDFGQDDKPPTPVTDDFGQDDTPPSQDGDTTDDA